MLDVSGPWAVLNYANGLVGRREYTLSLISPRGGDVTTHHGLVLGGTRSLSGAERQGLPDILFVAGGSPFEPLPEAESLFARWLRPRARKVPLVISICTGAFILGAAGLLDGHRATTHFKFTDELKRRFPRALVLREGIYQCNPRVWTSAGITAGIDLTLLLVEQNQGRPIAMAVARQLLLYLRRSGDQAQFSEPLKIQERESSQLRGVTQFVRDNLHEPLDVETLARRVGVSARSLTRWCRDELGESPATLVRRLRLEEARRLLEETALPLKSVATRAGLGDASTLYRVFRRALGVAPAEYRARFNRD